MNDVPTTYSSCSGSSSDCNDSGTEAGKERKKSDDDPGNFLRDAEARTLRLVIKRDEIILLSRCAASGKKRLAGRL